MNLTQQKRDKGHVTVRPHNVRIKGKVYRNWIVDLGKNPKTGKREARTFKTRAEADSFFDDQTKLRKTRGTEAGQLPHDTVLRFLAAERQLATAGGTIEQAVDLYVRTHRPVKEVLTLGQVKERFLQELELGGLSAHYRSTLGSSLGSFVGPRSGMLVTDVTRDMVKAWLFAGGWSPKTQRGYLTDVRTMLNWAVRERFLQANPLKGDDGFIRLPKLVKKEPVAFAPSQIRKLFETALDAQEDALDRTTGKFTKGRVYRSLIGYLALATFAGIRPHELVRLPVAAMDLDQALVGLDAAVAKTNDRRVIELSKNAVAWLRFWRKEFPDMKGFLPPSWDRHLKKLRKRAKLVPWPHDVLRHSFASYFHATHQDKAKLQAQMGHSEREDTLDKHYRAVRLADGAMVSPALAKEFWSILPPIRKSRGKKQPALVEPAA